MSYRVYTLTDDGTAWQFNSESDATLAATAINVQLGTAVTDVRVSANGYLGI